MTGGKHPLTKLTTNTAIDEHSFPVYHTQHAMTDASLNNPLRVKTGIAFKPRDYRRVSSHLEGPNLAGTQKVPFQSSVKPHLATTSVNFAKGGMLSSAKYPG